MLSWTSTNTALYLDGACLTNGPGITVLPNTTVISNGFTIGNSDAATGLLQMHGAVNSLTSYNYALDADTVSGEWTVNGIFYLHVSLYRAILPMRPIRRVFRTFTMSSAGKASSKSLARTLNNTLHQQRCLDHQRYLLARHQRVC